MKEESEKDAHRQCWINRVSYHAVRQIVDVVRTECSPVHL